MPKLDLKKEWKNLYNPSAREVSIVDVPPQQFAMFDGAGDPNTSRDFQGAIETLFGISYTLKFMLKKREGFPDYAVMPLEGLWWTDDMGSFSLDEKDKWQWTLMILQPDFVTPELFHEACAELERKKNPPALSRARLETCHEGLSAQILHIGPFSAEGPSIALIHATILKLERAPRGKHHEIYLSDFRRTAPEKLKTIIRQPME
jgi:hypothetical protein